MKKKTLAKSSRAIARLTANVDGLYLGISQQEAERLITNAIRLERACMRANYRSLFLSLRKVAVKQEKAFKKKQKAFKRKKAKAGRK